MMSEHKQLNKTRIYLRLSKDDERLGKSLSIDNQRLILRNYVLSHCGTIVDEYIDDGYSGTNFERPGAKRLLEDALMGKIDTISGKGTRSECVCRSWENYKVQHRPPFNRLIVL